MNHLAETVVAQLLVERGLQPAWPRPQLDPLPPKRSSDGRVGDTVARTKPGQRFAGAVKLGDFIDLFIVQASGLLTWRPCPVGDSVADLQIYGVSLPGSRFGAQ